MYEIELKAHVSDRKNTIQKLEKFAEFFGAVEKFDTYYSKNSSDKKSPYRIRKERPFKSEEIPSDKKNNSEKSIVFTYKKKETRLQNGNSMEVNDEKECFLSNAETIETFLLDNDFVPILQKNKIVLSWYFEDFHIELCSVPPLGDFLEIEYLSESDDEKTVNETRLKLVSILERAGIEKSKIENRYYSQMLDEVKNHKK